MSWLEVEVNKLAPCSEEFANSKVNNSPHHKLTRKGLAGSVKKALASCKIGSAPKVNSIEKY